MSNDFPVAHTRKLSILFTFYCIIYSIKLQYCYLKHTICFHREHMWCWVRIPRYDHVCQENQRDKPWTIKNWYSQSYTAPFSTQTFHHPCPLLSHLPVFRSQPCNFLRCWNYTGEVQRLWIYNSKCWSWSLIKLVNLLFVILVKKIELPTFWRSRPRGEI